MEKEDVHEIKHPSPTSPKKLKKDILKTKSKKLTKEAKEAVKNIDDDSESEAAVPEKK